MNLRDSFWKGNKGDISPPIQKESIPESFILTKFMREYNLTWEELLILPLPSYFIMLSDLMFENKQIKKEYDKVNEKGSKHG